jgi:sigma-E factor negative regulatory protein RseB
MQPSSATTRKDSFIMERVSTALFALILLLFTSATPADTADENVSVWLQRMVQAVHGLNYEGDFVYLHDNHLEAMRVVHTAKENGERERLISLNGSAREVVRDNASVTCITPDSKSVSVGERVFGKGFRAVLSMDADELSDLYDFVMIGTDRVANRPTRVIAIIPKDEYRYGYRIFLDEEHALPLKTDMLDSGGNAVSQVMFTNLRVSSDIEDRAETTLEGKELYRWVQQTPRPVRKQSQKSGWAFTKLPKGFQLSIHTRRSNSDEQTPINHFVLSDGLATLSVYIEKSTGQTGLKGSSRMGSVNAYGNTLNDYQITAVGEVPEITVRQIADTIRPEAE